MKKFVAKNSLSRRLGLFEGIVMFLALSLIMTLVLWSPQEENEPFDVLGRQILERPTGKVQAASLTFPQQNP